MGIFFRQFKELGVEKPIYTPFGRGDYIVNKASANLPSEIYYSAPKNSKRSQEFKDKYRMKYGTEPTAVSGAGAYDATILVLNAIKAGAKNTEEIINYLNDVKDYQGYSGLISFDDKNRVPTQEVELRFIKDGSYEVVR